MSAYVTGACPGCGYRIQAQDVELEPYGAQATCRKCGRLVGVRMEDGRAVPSVAERVALCVGKASFVTGTCPECGCRIVEANA